MTMTMTITMTITHSDEVTNKCQKPGSTDMSDGVMTPWKKNLCSAGKEGSRDTVEDSAQSHVGK